MSQAQRPRTRMKAAKNRARFACLEHLPGSGNDSRRLNAHVVRAATPGSLPPSEKFKRGATARRDVAIFFPARPDW